MQYTLHIQVRNNTTCLTESPMSRTMGVESTLTRRRIMVVTVTNHPSPIWRVLKKTDVPTHWYQPRNPAVVLIDIYLIISTCLIWWCLQPIYNTGQHWLFAAQVNLFTWSALYHHLPIRIWSWRLDQSGIAIYIPATTAPFITHPLGGSLVVVLAVVYAAVKWRCRTESMRQLTHRFIAVSTFSLLVCFVFGETADGGKVSIWFVLAVMFFSIQLLVFDWKPLHARTILVRNYFEQDELRHVLLLIACNFMLAACIIDGA